MSDAGDSAYGGYDTPSPVPSAHSSVSSLHVHGLGLGSLEGDPNDGDSQYGGSQPSVLASSGVLSDPGNPRRGSTSSEVSLSGPAPTQGHHRNNSGDSSYQSTLLARRNSYNPLAGHFNSQRRPSFPAQAWLDRSPSPEQRRHAGNRSLTNIAFTDPWGLHGTGRPSSPTRGRHTSGSTESRAFEDHPPNGDDRDRFWPQSRVHEVPPVGARPRPASLYLHRSSTDSGTRAAPGHRQERRQSESGVSRPRRRKRGSQSDAVVQEESSDDAADDDDDKSPGLRSPFRH